MNKIVIIFIAFVIFSCNKEDSSIVTPPKNEVTIPFETIAKGYIPYYYKGSDSFILKNICFKYDNDTDWNKFKTDYIDYLIIEQDSSLKNINYVKNDMIAIIPRSSSDYLSVDILKIIEKYTAYMIYYTNLGQTDLLLINTFYHIVKTKKLDKNKKIICIKQ